MTNAPKPKIFTKARVGNIMAAVTIMWTLWLWTDVIMMYSNTPNIDISDVTLTILAMWNVIAGIAAKHLWDNCASRD